ncbi:hypothetical protein JVU11DRAFT_12678 [Chiua virens]|nr:hypothetical protein JVU11DRAFT_12678 [Chiua virens]
MDAAKNGEQNADEDEELAPMDIPMNITHGGSSFGNLDSILPLEYPLSPTHPLSPFSSVPHPSKAGYGQPPSGMGSLAPTIVIQDIRTVYHSRPGEIYLGAWTSGGRLKMYGLYDSNVHEEVVVKEWLGEIKSAVLWYLGRTHEPRQAPNRSGQVETGLGKVEQAKL